MFYVPGRMRRVHVVYASVRLVIYAFVFLYIGPQPLALSVTSGLYKCSGSRIRRPR